MGCLPRALHARRSFSRTRLKLPRPRLAGHLPRLRGDYTLPRSSSGDQRSPGEAMIVPRAPRILPRGSWPHQCGPGRERQVFPALSLPSALNQDTVERPDSTGLRKAHAYRQHDGWAVSGGGGTWSWPGIAGGGTQAGPGSSRPCIHRRSPVEVSQTLLECRCVLTQPAQAVSTLASGSMSVQLRQKAPRDRLLLKGPFSSLI